jgi:hypothetical protein
MAGKGSWLAVAGKAIVKGIEFLASPNGQKIVAAGETAAEIAFPPSTAIIAIVNVVLNRVTEVQAKAAAAADLGAVATNEQKAAAAIAAVVPDIEALVAQYHLVPLTPEQLKAINDAVVAIAGTVALAGPGPVTPPPPPPAA